MFAGILLTHISRRSAVKSADEMRKARLARLMQPTTPATAASTASAAATLADMNSEFRRELSGQAAKRRRHC